MPPLPTIALIAASDGMKSVLRQADTVAGSDTSVLLTGETGSGKELLAEYIHYRSSRAGRPIVKVGLAALPPDLLESELFGHDRGAFTGANSEKKGLFEIAHTGTIFLDDIDDFPVSLQAKLLRVLESREVLRVGGTSSTPVDVRVITATKIDLRDLVQRGLFRSDLYYRINVVPISLPPLRERAGDIPLLIRHFLHRYKPSEEVVVEKEALELLCSHPWPGNIRELRNLVQRLALFCDGVIHAYDLPPEFVGPTPVEALARSCNVCLTEGGMSYDDVIACMETHLLRSALERNNGNRSHAARMLGLSLSTFRDRLKKYHLDDHPGDS